MACILLLWDGSGIDNAVEKAGESFNPQDLLRDGHNLRSFSRELTGPEDGGELAVSTNNA